MGMSGRINPNPTRSISTVKKMIPSDFFFMQRRNFQTVAAAYCQTFPNMKHQTSAPAPPLGIHPRRRRFFEGGLAQVNRLQSFRSEERRVGKECRSRESP